MARKVWTFNVAVDFWRHPKAVAAGRDGRDLFLCALGWCGEYHKNGTVPAEILDLLAGQVGITSTAARRAARRLVDVGLFHNTDSGWQVHDYCGPDGWQASAEEREAAAAANAERQRRWKERQLPDPPDNGPGNGGSNGPGNALPNASEDAQRELRGFGFGSSGLDSDLTTRSAMNGDSSDEPCPGGQQDDQVNAQFETFWGQFPKRQGRLRDRDGTLRRWRRLTATDRENALVAVPNYAAERGDDKPTAAKDPDRWLKDRTWADYLDPASPVAQLDQRRRPGRVMPSERYAARRQPSPGDAS